MTTQHERAQVFASLHVRGNPVILFNIWDAGSAKAVQEIGAKAIATGSWSVAAAQGYTDGEKVPFEAVLTNTERIVASVDLPVTIDFEGGYGASPAQLQANIARLIQAGAIGINFEDQIVGGEGLYPIEKQVARIRAIREAADHAAVPLFINARTDIFLKLKPADHNAQQLEAALERAAAYAEAGASGFFAPGLRDAPSIKTLCEQSSLPVNHMMVPDGPSPKQLAALGVARISYAGAPYRVAIEAFKEAGRKALSLPE